MKWDSMGNYKLGRMWNQWQAAIFHHLSGKTSRKTQLIFGKDVKVSGSKSSQYEDYSL